MLGAFAQAVDSLPYKNRKLKVEEINFVSSYYHQEGNNSAVTGGIGTEKLSDYSNTFDVKLVKYDKLNRKRNLDIYVGVDYYTSASSDKIDLQANSSASCEDLRVYPNVSWSIENEEKGTTVGTNISSSIESDYLSFGFSGNFSKKTADKNGEFGIKGQVYLDRVKLVLPIELRDGTRDFHDYDKTPRNTFGATLSYSQIINQRLQMMMMIDVAYQKGFLGLPFHRVYFMDSTLKAEMLPSTRFKLPVSLRANYFLGNKILLRSFYRFYKDDWGLKAHTMELEIPVKITPFFSFSPFYRFYTQQGIDYFSPYRSHALTDRFFSSNYDLSSFDSHFFGAGLKIDPPRGILGNKHWTMIELRYGHYKRSNTLSSDIVSMNLKFK